MSELRPRTITLYRDDSTVQVVYERVKAAFWTADNTVLVISQYTGKGEEHRYVHWPRERICWFKDEWSRICAECEMEIPAGATITECRIPECPEVK